MMNFEFESGMMARFKEEKDLLALEYPKDFAATISGVWVVLNNMKRHTIHLTGFDGEVIVTYASFDLDEESLKTLGNTTGFEFSENMFSDYIQKPKYNYGERVYPVVSKPLQILIPSWVKNIIVFDRDIRHTENGCYWIYTLLINGKCYFDWNENEITDIKSGQN